MRSSLTRALRAAITGGDEIKAPVPLSLVFQPKMAVKSKADPYNHDLCVCALSLRFS
jgi:hypothetical protein